VPTAGSVNSNRERLKLTLESPPKPVGVTSSSSLQIGQIRNVGSSLCTPRGGIDFADVWAHGDTTYVGSRCGPDATGGGGVRVVDISNPRQPAVVGTLPNPEFTRAEDVVVKSVSTPSFSGVKGAKTRISGLNSGFDTLHAKNPVRRDVAIYRRNTRFDTCGVSKLGSRPRNR
jgi:hypothetical protein